MEIWMGGVSRSARPQRRAHMQIAACQLGMAIVLADTATAKTPARRDPFAGGGTNARPSFVAGFTVVRYMFRHEALAPTRSFLATAGYLSKHVSRGAFACVAFSPSATVLCAFVAFSRSVSLFVGVYKDVFRSVAFTGDM